jgi:hypothetical protein
MRDDADELEELFFRLKFSDVEVEVGKDGCFLYISKAEVVVAAIPNALINKAF